MRSSDRRRRNSLRCTQVLPEQTWSLQFTIIRALLVRSLCLPWAYSYRGTGEGTPWTSFLQAIYDGKRRLSPTHVCHLPCHSMLENSGLEMFLALIPIPILLNYATHSTS